MFCDTVSIRESFVREPCYVFVSDILIDTSDTLKNIRNSRVLGLGEPLAILSSIGDFLLFDCALPTVCIFNYFITSRFNYYYIILS